MNKIQDLDFCLVSTPDLLNLAPNGEWLPIPVDLEKIEPFRIDPVIDGKSPNISHYPYYLNKPDWDYFTPTFAELEKENKLKVIKVINLNHASISC